MATMEPPQPPPSNPGNPSRGKKLKEYVPDSIGSLILPTIFVMVLPLSVTLWLGHLAFSILRNDKHPDSDIAAITPVRWLASTLIPTALVLHALKSKHVSKSGAALGSFIAFILTLANYSFLACLMAFFFSSSKATKFRQERKKKIEEDFKEGGQRNWIQVICNGGMALQLAFLYILDYGCGEHPINFINDYRGSWLSLGVLGSFACCNGDTWASELGTVIGNSEPYLITTWRKVPRGTNGGVTIQGLIFSAAGGAFVGLCNYLSIMLWVNSSQLESSPPQWPLIVAGALAGLFGSLLDSLLGATLQYSGVDKRSGKIVERRGKDIHHISGTCLLDNHGVNLISSAVLGLVTPKLANIFWPSSY